MKFFNSRKAQLVDLVPEDKGYPFTQERLEIADGKIMQEFITEILVRCKLFFLLKEIGATFPNGTPWPKPCTGFLKFYRMLEEINSGNGIKIWLAVISSGHDIFIRKTLSLWRIPYPEIILTDDDMRGCRFVSNPKNKVKPSPLIFDLVHSLWIQELAEEESLNYSPGLLEIIRRSFNQMAYCGDDLEKDGKLAENAGVPFLWFNPGRNVNTSGISVLYNFDDWEALGRFLGQREVLKAMRSNAHFHQILKTGRAQMLLLFLLKFIFKPKIDIITEYKY